MVPTVQSQKKKTVLGILSLYITSCTEDNDISESRAFMLKYDAKTAALES